MATELSAFAKIAVYLKDPLVLSGFVIFVGFLGLRQILQANIIPPLGRGHGFRLLRLLLSYGFVIGLLVVLLGMGLKYRDISEQEQRRAAALVIDELRTNATVVSELEKNSNSLSRIALGVAGILRDERFKILNGLFSAKNIDSRIDQSSLTNLYIERLDWLAESGLWNDADEKRRAIEACAAIVRFVDRVQSTIESLTDPQSARYPIARKAYDANLDVIRRINVVDMTKLAELYYRMSDARVLYNRMTLGTIEYTQAVKGFCSNLPPNEADLSAALAVERLTLRLLPEYRTRLENTLAMIADRISALRTSLPES